MMRGYDGASADRPTSGKCYRVVRSGEGWSIQVNGCATRPMPDRKAATRLARKLQRERNHLTGHRASGAVQ